MGKDLNGKNIGTGLCQRKDGKYSARFTDKYGQRVEKHFLKLADAKRWLADAKYEDRHLNLCMPKKITVNEWYEYWLDNMTTHLSANTKRNYNDRYTLNIKPLIGSMQINNVKQIHCHMILNEMRDKYAGSTIRQTYITLGVLFRAAVVNSIIAVHPMDKMKYSIPVKAANDIKCLTIEEQRKFLEVAKRSHNYRQYVFLLETGLRTGEMIGITWNDIDWDARTLTINKTMEYRYSTKAWRVGPPKTRSSYRTIPLTDTAYEILKSCYDERNTRKLSEEASEQLEYLDIQTGLKKMFKFSDLAFINFRTGMPNKSSSYDTHLYKLCDEAEIKRFGMHTLRHTYATRAIEAGVPPKALQKLLGHAHMSTTMDRYVHATNDMLENAVKTFSIGAELVRSNNTQTLETA